jgi:hypothetical protein
MTLHAIPDRPSIQNATLTQAAKGHGRVKNVHSTKNIAPKTMIPRRARENADGLKARRSNEK